MKNAALRFILSNIAQGRAIERERWSLEYFITGEAWLEACGFVKKNSQADADFFLKGLFFFLLKLQPEVDWFNFAAVPD